MKHGTVKWHTDNDDSTEQQALTDQARQEKPRPGFPGRSCTSLVADYRHKPTAPRSNGCVPLGRDPRQGVTHHTVSSMHATTHDNGSTTLRVSSLPLQQPLYNNNDIMIALCYRDSIAAVGGGDDDE